MGHWAEIDENNVVIRVLVIKEAELDTGNWGDKSKWIKTSYNTHQGKHYVPSEKQNFSEESADQSKSLRFKFAGPGDIYDPVNDIFYEPQPFSSWTWVADTYSWAPPIEQPDDGKKYEWNEDLYQSDNTKGWVEYGSGV